MSARWTPVEHGGPDHLGPLRWDFSTNANPLVPEAVVAALASCSRLSYPEPSYASLRQALARHAGVDAERIVPSAGSSEAIRRLSLAASLSGVREVWVPQPGYGDYAAAAQALGLAVRGYDGHTGEGLQEGIGVDGVGAGDDVPSLVWVCDPCNPTGLGASSALLTTLRSLLSRQPDTWLAIDRAYEALRLAPPRAPWPPDLLACAWQLMSPNKALGLTGVRAGWVIAPAGSPRLTSMHALAPSWVLSAEGVCLLQHWVLPETQAWLHAARLTLLDWRDQQHAMLREMGCHVADTDTPFGLVSPPPEWGIERVHARREALRQRGIKLRDATSLGAPGRWRLGTLSPQAQADLAQAWAELEGPSR